MTEDRGAALGTPLPPSSLPFWQPKPTSHNRHGIQQVEPPRVRGLLKAPRAPMALTDPDWGRCSLLPRLPIVSRNSCSDGNTCRRVPFNKSPAPESPSLMEGRRGFCYSTCNRCFSSAYYPLISYLFHKISFVSFDGYTAARGGDENVKAWTGGQLLPRHQVRPRKFVL